jgi:Tfp pilus assembly protein FimT
MTQRSYRAIDLVVAIGIVGLLVALLIPTLSSRAIMLPTATRELVGHLRLARAGAASRGAHFRVTLRTHTYAIEQLQDNNGDGIWEPDGKLPVWHVSLPPTVAVGTAADTAIEFDTRGLVSAGSQDDIEAPVTVELKDSQTEQSTVIEILPSGKVQRLFGGIVRNEVRLGSP